MYLWGGSWSPRPTPLPPWRSPIFGFENKTVLSPDSFSKSSQCKKWLQSKWTLDMDLDGFHTYCEPVTIRSLLFQTSLFWMAVFIAVTLQQITCIFISQVFRFIRTVFKEWHPGASSWFTRWDAGLWVSAEMGWDFWEPWEGLSVFCMYNECK